MHLPPPPIAEPKVGNQQGEELETGDKLVIPSEAGMEAALVENEAGIQEGQAFERDGRTDHVLAFFGPLRRFRMRPDGSFQEAAFEG